MDFDQVDKIAADYLNGDEQRRQAIAQELSKDPSASRKRGIFIVMMVLLLGLTAGMNLYLASVPADVIKLDWVSYAVINLAALVGISKVGACYLMSKASVYPLLKRFADRHPRSPLVLRLRDAKGEYDWNKVVPMK